METATTACGPDTVVEQGQWPDGRHHHVLETVGMDVAVAHDLRHSKRTLGGPARNVLMDVKAQARVGSGLALWKE